MNIKHNPFKILIAFLAAFITVVSGSSSAKALSAETKTLSELTIEERLANVREQIVKIKGQDINESDAASNSHLNSEAKGDRIY